MGCGLSKPKAEPQRLQVSAPQGGLELIPRTRRDAQGVPIRHKSYELDRVHLQRALGYAAEYLHRHGANVILIAVGGAVNTILLQTRQTTHDVDFFLPPNSNDARSQADLIEQASISAEAQASLPLGGDWLNNSISLYIPQTLRQELSHAAIQQNVIVFENPGLTVLAAPWLYALCGKLQKLLEETNSKPYDASDAATYLYHHLCLHGMRNLPYAFLVESALHYQMAIDQSVCQIVDDEYEARYHSRGIIF